MLVWLFLGPCLLSPLGLLLGEKGSPRNLAIILGGLGAVLAGFLAGPLYLRSFNRRRTARLLGPVVDPAVRVLSGIRSWGLLGEVLILRALPAGEPAIPLQDVVSGQSVRRAKGGLDPDVFRLSGERFPWSITWRAGSLVCEGCGASYAGTGHLLLRPVEGKWQAFWNSLDELGAWSWEGDYANNPRIMILGGTPWTLSVRRGDRTLECRGNANNPEANPAGFERLVEAILELLRDGTVESTAVRVFVEKQLKR
jgi:hypothetical protein